MSPKASFQFDSCSLASGGFVVLQRRLIRQDCNTAGTNLKTLLIMDDFIRPGVEATPLYRLLPLK